MKNINAEIANFIESNEHSEIYTNLCGCGAITMSSYGSQDSIQFLQENAPYIKPTNDMIMCNCNHCCNNWGLDVEEEIED